MSTPQHTEFDERYATYTDRLYIIVVVTTHHSSFYTYSSRSHTLSDHLQLGIMTHGTESAKSIMHLGTGSAGCGSSLAKAKAMLPNQLYSCKSVHCSLSFTNSMRSSSIHTAARAGKAHFCCTSVPLILHHVRVFMSDKNCCTRQTRAGAAIVVRRTESDGRKVVL